MKELNYEHYFQIDMKRELVKVSLIKIMKTVSYKISFFRSEISALIKMLNEIKLLNEVIMYGNEKAVKAFIKLVEIFFKLSLNKGFVKMLEKN